MPMTKEQLLEENRRLEEEVQKLQLDLVKLNNENERMAGELAHLRVSLESAELERDTAKQFAVDSAPAGDDPFECGQVLMWHVDGSYRDFDTADELAAAQHETGNAWFESEKEAASERKRRENAEAAA